MQKSAIGFITLLVVIFSFLNACQTSLDQKATLDRHLVELFQDKKVKVYGKYAALKLPIENGTQVWNPVQVVRGPDSVMYVANNTGEIYALEDTDGDRLEDYARFFCDV